MLWLKHKVTRDDYDEVILLKEVPILVSLRQFEMEILE